MPAAEVEFSHRDESLDRVFDFGNGEEDFGMRHETVIMHVSANHSILTNVSISPPSSTRRRVCIAHSLRYALQHGSRLEYECRQRDSTQIRARPQLAYNVHENCSPISALFFLIPIALHCFLLLMTWTARESYHCLAQHPPQFHHQ